MMKNSIVLFAKVLVVLLLVARPAQAAITFTAGSAQVAPGQSYNVPITVSGFTDVVGFQFTLQWDPNVLQFSSVTGLGLAGLTYIGLDDPVYQDDNFGTQLTSVGKLTVSRNNSAQTVNDGTSIFAINYTAVGVAGQLTSILFVDDLMMREVFLSGLSPVEFASTPGNVSVVPEPTDIALGIFAGLFAGTTTLGWVINRRSARLAEQR
jgi:hypothetical protein